MTVNRRIYDEAFSEESAPSFSLDDCQEPAAGYRNDSSLNNAGSNGNYWSATPNGSDSNNSYELNFNSGNFNVNNNNRYYGQSVRAVSEQADSVATSRFSISRQQLLLDLYRAYKDARRHKRGRRYQIDFEMNLEENLVALCDELLSETYAPRPSRCFIIHDPKMREVFAADFRDRIVHHLFFNYTHVLFERTFITDSYSCIKGRGTHYGIKRLLHHIRSVSDNYTRSCYILQMDIRGYFMSISRHILLRLCRDLIRRMKNHPSDIKGQTWEEKLDYPLVDYLLEKIVTTNPVDGCIVIGDKSEWQKLPPEKSLFQAKEGCGLPIGNLSSQLFSNVYMNVLDQYVKRTLRSRHYGRYVDDAYVVGSDRNELKQTVQRISGFLTSELQISLHPYKIRIVKAEHGVQFLGAFLKPYRSYILSSTLRRMKKKLYRLKNCRHGYSIAAINSFLGVLSHHSSLIPQHFDLTLFISS